MFELIKQTTMKKLFLLLFAAVLTLSTYSCRETEETEAEIEEVGNDVESDLEETGEEFEQTGEEFENEVENEEVIEDEV